VREQNEWVNGHLPHAIFISKGIIERDINNVVSDVNAHIVLYCGGDSHSALAADNLQKMGYTHVESMQGGFRNWQDAGYLLET